MPDFISLTRDITFTTFLPDTTNDISPVFPHNILIMPIQILPESLVKRIAAGEVIERPLSVVKELLENSIDAGSSRIEIKLEEGGIESITVIDNGSGIPKDDIPKLLHRHSTSKIVTEDDLYTISTLGFRGEALYSIASVTKLRIRTRHHDDTEGTELVSEDGRIEIHTISAPIGTTIESTGLFYNTPARRKFLKSPSSEYQKIAEVVTRYVLAYPSISFELLHNGKSVLKSLGGSPQDPLIALWGAKVASQMLPVDFRAGEIRITGFISSPALSRTNRKDITIFVNGRLVRDSTIAASIERAYHGNLPPGRFPIAILKIELPSTEVDVNVHPNKKEVRLADPGAIFKDVQVAIDRALALTRPLKSPTGGTIIPETGEVIRGGGQGASQGGYHQSWHGSARELPAEVFFPGMEQESQTEPLFSGEIVPRTIRRGDVIEFLDTYLAFEDGGELAIVDFHNLHERILFEEMQDAERSSGASVLSQKLMFPESFTLPPHLAQIVEEESEFLNRMGFEIEPFGSGAFILRGVPHFLKDAQAADAVLDILTEVNREIGASHSPGDFTRHFKATAACKAAVKAGARLKPEEIDFIIRHAKDSRYLTCPHGRPTLIKLDREFFDRRFKRRSHE
jgi:DNA mismatch repair protein MutL